MTEKLVKERYNICGREDHANGAAVTSEDSLDADATYSSLEDKNCVRQSCSLTLEPPTLCKVCGKIFDDISSLDVHCRMEHDEKAKSEALNRAMSVSFGKISPLRAVSPNDKTSADQSSSPERPTSRHSLSTDGHLSDEEKDIDTETFHICKECNKIFDSEASMNNHVCKKMVDGEASVNEHAPSEETSTVKTCKSRLCEQCGNTFDSDDSYKYHLCNRRSSEVDRAFNLHIERIVESVMKCPICKQCGKAFEDKVAYDTHICNRKAYEVEQSLKNHGETVVEDGKKCHVCKHCGKTFPWRSFLLRHLRSHSDEKPYVCSQCGRAFTHKYNLLEHVRTHSMGERPKIHICNQCGKAYRKKNDLMRHGLSHTGEKPYICNKCGKSFSWKSSLDRHSRFHTGENLHICSQCGEAFSAKFNLVIHSRIHTGEKPYPCEHCGKAFSVKSHLLRHIRTHTGEKPCVCTLCGKAFSQKSNLRKHMKVHEQPEPGTEQYRELLPNDDGYKEDDVNSQGDNKSTEKGSNQQSKYAIAKRRVSPTKVSEKRYPCDKCSKAFSAKSHLQRHLHTHTGERPYSCDICGKGFSQKGNLRKHRKMHFEKEENEEKQEKDRNIFQTFGENGPVGVRGGKVATTDSDDPQDDSDHGETSAADEAEKPFPCPHCDKRFTSRTHLVRHQYVHTGERPHACAFCGKTFTQKSNLHMHIKKMHAEAFSQSIELYEQYGKMLKTKKDRKAKSSNSRSRMSATENSPRDQPHDESVDNFSSSDHEHRDSDLSDNRPESSQSDHRVKGSLPGRNPGGKRSPDSQQGEQSSSDPDEDSVRSNRERQDDCQNEASRSLFDPPILCKICGKTFKDNNQLNEHWNREHLFEDKIKDEPREADEVNEVSDAHRKPKDRYSDSSAGKFMGRSDHRRRDLHLSSKHADQTDLRHRDALSVGYRDFKQSLVDQSNVANAMDSDL